MIWTFPGDIDHGASVTHITDDDIHVDGKVDGGSTAVLVSNRGSITIDGKVDRGSNVWLVAAGDIRIGVGQGGDNKVDGRQPRGRDVGRVHRPRRQDRRRPHQRRLQGLRRHQHRRPDRRRCHGPADGRDGADLGGRRHRQQLDPRAGLAAEVADGRRRDRRRHPCGRGVLGRGRGPLPPVRPARGLLVAELAADVRLRVAAAAAPPLAGGAHGDGDRRRRRRRGSRCRRAGR